MAKATAEGRGLTADEQNSFDAHIANVENNPRMEGRMLHIVLSPRAQH